MHLSQILRTIVKEIFWNKRSYFELTFFAESIPSDTKKLLTLIQRIMSIKTYLSLGLLISTLFACGGKTESKDESSASEVVKESCLAELVEGNEIEKMISKTQMAKLAGVSEEKIEMTDSKSSSAKYSFSGFKWEPEVARKMILKTKLPAGPDGKKSVMESEMEAENKISFGQLDILDGKSGGPKEYFRYTYGPKTKEEKEAIKESIDRSKESSEKVNEKSAETIKNMVDKQSSTEVKVGDLAYWSVTPYKNFYTESGEEETEAKIQVLHGNTMFSVSANVSDNIEEDLAMAKKVAQQIIDNCK